MFKLSEIVSSNVLRYNLTALPSYQIRSVL